MKAKQYDVAIIGGGIVGMAVALALMERSDKSNRSRSRLSVIVLEAEDHLAAHQTGNNSGVIHSGLYYKPGSLKAQNCVAGRQAMYRFCREHDIACEQCGKVVVATTQEELPALANLEQRGRENGLEGLQRLTPAEIHEHEPYVTGLAGLFVPVTGIVDYTQVTETFAKLVKAADGEICTNTRFLGLQQTNGSMVLETNQGEIIARHLINCSGLQSDRVARKCGVEPTVKIIPFRGEYYELVAERHDLVKNLVYPVPDPRFPFLGVHYTRMIHGGVEAGPNAVLAFKREGYHKLSFSPLDTLETFSYWGFWRMGVKYLKMGLGEYYRSFNRRAFVSALQRLIPELHYEDVHPAGAGVRAQALTKSGALLDDFCIIEAERMIHVLNAPSPAATASISIGQTIAQMASKNFSLSG